MQVSADLFTKLDYIGRHLRRKPLVPFGGIQIIVVGDFFQLPPVPTKRSDCQCPTCGSQVKQYTKPGSKSDDGMMVCSPHMHGADPKNCGQEYCRLTKLAFQPGPKGEKSWEECKFMFEELTQVFRQTDDEFIGVVNRVRLNKTEPDDWIKLDKCKIPLKCEDGVLPTKLCKNELHSWELPPAPRL